ncbi:hypothetical protein GCM10007359_17790 [Rothia aerolata]|uniref:Uncharacterized protein n=1 Tax=Rothia aerolata TaxID=1812262 RepID=A0A917IVB4_9MICC|nr:hypothetical protein GCM10007359_17790 [Rothia aerolata]
MRDESLLYDPPLISVVYEARKGRTMTAQLNENQMLSETNFTEALDEVLDQLEEVNKALAFQ